MAILQGIATEDIKCGSLISYDSATGCVCLVRIKEVTLRVKLLPTNLGELTFDCKEITLKLDAAKAAGEKVTKIVALIPGPTVIFGIPVEYQMSQEEG